MTAVCSSGNLETNVLLSSQLGANAESAVEQWMESANPEVRCIMLYCEVSSAEKCMRDTIQVHSYSNQVETE